MYIMNEKIDLTPWKDKEEDKEKISSLKEILMRASNTSEEVVKINDFGHFLKDKYPNCLDYRLYHLIIGSTPWKECLSYDFEGEDSVEKFLRELYS